MDRAPRWFEWQPTSGEVDLRHAGDMHSYIYAPRDPWHGKGQTFYRAVVADEHDPLARILNSRQSPYASGDSGDVYQDVSPHPYEYYDSYASPGEPAVYKPDIQVSRPKKRPFKRNKSKLFRSLMDLTPRGRVANENAHIELPSDTKVMAWLDDCDDQNVRRAASLRRNEGDIYYRGDIFYNHPNH